MTLEQHAEEFASWLLDPGNIWSGQTGKENIFQRILHAFEMVEADVRHECTQTMDRVLRISEERSKTILELHKEITRLQAIIVDMNKPEAPPPTTAKDELLRFLAVIARADAHFGKRREMAQIIKDKMLKAGFLPNELT